MGRAPGLPADSAVPSWQITVAISGDCAVVTVAGELDLQTAPQLDAALSSVEAPGRSVTIDLRALTFMDSSGINLLVRHVARAACDGFVLSMITPPARVSRVLDIAGVTDLLPLVEAPEPLPDGSPSSSQPAPRRRPSPDIGRRRRSATDRPRRRP